MFEIINEELRIKSCSIKDLSQETIKLLHEQLEGVPDSIMTFFYDTREDYVILNRDNDMYGTYALLVKEYLDGDNEIRGLIQKSCGDLIKKTFIILDEVIRRRNRRAYEVQAAKIMRITREMFSEPFWNNYGVIREMQKEAINDYNSHKEFLGYDIFMYGYMLGKRAERARRKKAKSISVIQDNFMCSI